MCFLQAAREGFHVVGDRNQMDVIAHQAISDQFHTVSLHALLQQIEVDATLSLPFKDEAPRISALSDVMGNAWSNHTSESDHSST